MVDFENLHILNRYNSKREDLPNFSQRLYDKGSPPHFQYKKINTLSKIEDYITDQNNSFMINLEQTDKTYIQRRLIPGLEILNKIPIPQQMLNDFKLLSISEDGEYFTIQHRTQYSLRVEVYDLKQFFHHFSNQFQAQKDTQDYTKIDNIPQDSNFKPCLKIKLGVQSKINFAKLSKDNQRIVIACTQLYPYLKKEIYSQSNSLNGILIIKIQDQIKSEQKEKFQITQDIFNQLSLKLEVDINDQNRVIISNEQYSFADIQNVLKQKLNNYLKQTWMSPEFEIIINLIDWHTPTFQGNLKLRSLFRNFRFDKIMNESFYSQQKQGLMQRLEEKLKKDNFQIHVDTTLIDQEYQAEDVPLLEQASSLEKVDSNIWVVQSKSQQGNTQIFKINTSKNGIQEIKFAQNIISFMSKQFLIFLNPQKEEIEVRQFSNQNDVFQKLYTVKLIRDNDLKVKVETFKVINVSEFKITYLINENLFIDTQDVFHQNIQEIQGIKKIENEGKTAEPSTENKIFSRSLIISQSNENKILIHECQDDIQVNRAHFNQFYPGKMLVQQSAQDFYLATYPQRSSLFKIWNKNSTETQGFQTYDYEQEILEQFGDIVGDKIKRSPNQDHLLYALVRGFQVMNSDGFNQEERWLGFLWEGVFYKSIKLTQYDDLKTFLHFIPKNDTADNDSFIKFLILNDRQIFEIGVNEKFEEISRNLIFELKEAGSSFLKIKVQISDDGKDITLGYLAMSDQNGDYTNVFGSKELYRNREVEEVSVSLDLQSKRDVHPSRFVKAEIYNLKNQQFIHLTSNFKTTYYNDPSLTKLRDHQNFKIEKIKALDRNVLIKSDDNRLFFANKDFVTEVRLPKQLLGKKFKMRRQQITESNAIYLYFDQDYHNHCSVKDSESILELSFAKSSGSPYNFEDSSLPTAYSSFEYYDDENNKYVIYDKLTNKNISFLEASYTQAEIKLIFAIQNTPTRDIIKLIQRGPKQINQLLKKYDCGNLLTVINLNENALQALLDELLLMQKEDIPLLFLMADLLNSAIRKEMKRCVSIMLELYLNFQDSYALWGHLDKNFNRLVENGYDIKEFIEKELVLKKITEMQHLPNFLSKNENQTYEIELDKNPIHYLENYEVEFEESKHYCDENQIQQPYPCEFYISCLPETMFFNIDFLRSLQFSNDLSIFENIGIQNLIDHTWFKGNYQHLKLRMYIYLVFLFVLVFQTCYSVFGKDIDDETGVITDNRAQWLVKLTNWILGIYNTFYLYEIYKLIRLTWHENLRAKSSRRKQSSFFKNMWNIVSLFIIVSLYPIIIIDNQEQDYYGIRIWQLILLALCFIKLNYYLQVLEGFGFMVQMVIQVFLDLKFFATFFLFILVEFGLLFFLVNQRVEMSDYVGLSNFGGYMMMSFRLSTGDFQLDGFQDLQGLFILISWGIWLIAVFALNMIFLNFIIAVISETYDKVMQTSVPLQYRMKCAMINMEYRGQGKLYTSLVLRKMIEVSQDEQSWQGFVKTIKNQIKTFSKQTNIKISQNLTELDQKIDQNLTDLVFDYDQEKKEIFIELDQISELYTQLQANE